MAYTRFDRFVAHQRFRAALPYLKPRSVICDVGCGLEAAFLTYASPRLAWGVGLDDQVRSCPPGPCSVVRADITRTFPLADERFDHVVMLAVLEHLRDPHPVLCEVFRILRPRGSLVMTWPRGVVDPILGLLHNAGLISNEMESDEHQPRVPRETLLAMLSDIGFRDCVHRRFELGLNNLLVAFKP